MKFFRRFRLQFDGIGHPIELKISYFNRKLKYIGKCIKMPRKLGKFRKFKYLYSFNRTGYKPEEVKKWIIVQSTPDIFT